ncbi:MAG: ABC transporter substrate-binding protein, partial [Pseudomonadota bacterium]
MKNALITLGLAAALALPTTAGAETLRMAFSSAPRSIDPYPFGGTPTASLKEHVFEALVAADDSPLLAESWEWTSPTSLTVTLRQGISFHNGGA